MDFRNLKGNDLADFAANLVTLLGGTGLSAIDEHVRTDLVTAFGTLPATLSSTTAAAVIADDEKRSLFAARNDVSGTVSDLCGRVRDHLRAGDAPKSQYELAGFDYPATPVSTYTAQDPSGLSVTGTSNGVNTGKFSGNNPGNRVVYDIWRRHGDEGLWVQHLTTTRQSFTDVGVTPGQYYEYKVRSIAAKTVSNFSNSAVVYGVL